MKPFVLSYTFSNPEAMDKAIFIIDEYAEKYPNDTTDMTIKEIIRSIDPAFYDSLTRGDKCRIGRAFSKMHYEGKILCFERGERKGVTNTYHTF